jgi:hypothetical protein
MLDLCRTAQPKINITYKLSVVTISPCSWFIGARSGAGATGCICTTAGAKSDAKIAAEFVASGPGTNPNKCGKCANVGGAVAVVAVTVASKSASLAILLAVRHLLLVAPHSPLLLFVRCHGMGLIRAKGGHERRTHLR